MFVATDTEQIVIATAERSTTQPYPCLGSVACSFNPMKCLNWNLEWRTPGLSAQVTEIIPKNTPDGDKVSDHAGVVQEIS